MCRFGSLYKMYKLNSNRCQGNVSVCMFCGFVIVNEGNLGEFGSILEFSRMKL